MTEDKNQERIYAPLIKTFKTETADLRKKFADKDQFKFEVQRAGRKKNFSRRFETQRFA